MTRRERIVSRRFDAAELLLEAATVVCLALLAVAADSTGTRIVAAAGAIIWTASLVLSVVGMRYRRRNHKTPD